MLRVDPVLAKNEVLPVQILNISIDSFSSSGHLSIEVLEKEQITEQLHYGLNTFQVELPQVDQEQDISVEFLLNKSLIKEQKATLKPVIPRTVFILPYSHNDIGYIDIQSHVMEKQCQNIDLELQMAEETSEYPKEAMAKWNLEVIWALEHCGRERMRQTTNNSYKQFIQAI
ncbi:MAG TPA: hypothetical protein PLE74_01285 [Candidatus Cloacimonadota bacterium]|nr:hypothetical protein [Candidatus Cloacimonadota bacterium]